MKKLIIFFTIQLLFVRNYSQSLDSVEYYSYIDTVMLMKHLKMLNLRSNEEEGLYYLYAFNFYAVQRDFVNLNHKFKLIERNALIKEKYYEKFLETKFWYHCLLNQRDSINHWYKVIVSSNQFSKSLKIRVLNILSYYYSKYNLLLSARCLNVATMLGLNDSLPELYRTFLNLSGIYFAMNFAEEGKKMIERGKKFKKKNYNPILDYLYIHNEAIYYIFTKDYNKAIKNYWQTHHFFKKYMIPEYYAGSVINLARLYYYTKDLDSMYIIFKKNDSFIKKNESKLSPNFLLRYYWLIGDLYFYRHTKDSALHYILKAIDIAEKYQFLEVQGELYFDYANIIKEKNIHQAYQLIEKAFNNTIKYNELIHLNFINENAQKLKLLENSIKINEYERNLIEAKLNYHKLQNRNIYILTTIGFLTIISLLYLRILYMRRVQKMKQKFTEQMILQHEKTLQHVSNELHDNIASSLNILSKNLQNSEDIKTINAIIDDIRSLSHISYPSYLFNLPFIDTLEAMLHKIEITSTHTIIKNIDMSINNLSNNDKIQIYRILQELINNTIKYNIKTTIKINFFIRNNYLYLQYEDFNFDVKTKKIIKGFGLQSIEQRTMIMQAKCKYQYYHGFKFELWKYYEKNNITR